MSVSGVQQVGDVIVLVHPSGAIANDEYNQNLAQLRAWAAGRRRGIMVVWGDGVINSAQRAAIMSFVKEPARLADGSTAQLRLVLFTSSTLTRGVLQALAWMGAQIATHPKRDVAVGLRAEGVDDGTIAEIERAIRRIDDRVRADRGVISSSHA